MNEIQNSNSDDCRNKIQNNFQYINYKSQGKKRVYDLRERLLLFSKRIIDIGRLLPRMPECDGIRRQLINAGTSVGANYEEADGALTKKDFINKVCISRKEAKEVRYWLRVVSNTYLQEKEIAADIIEAEEIICILSAIIRNSQAKE